MSQYRALRGTLGVVGSIVLLVAIPVPSAAAATICSISWINTLGGDWSTPSNWSPSRVPVDSDNVCITTAGTYTVQLTNSSTNLLSVSVNSLTLGGSSGQQTLDIFGQNPNNTIFDHGVALVLTGIVRPRGVVYLTTADQSDISGLDSAGSASLGTTLTNNGKIIAPLGPGTPTIFGQVVNNGTMSIQTPTLLSADGSDFTFTNNKLFAIASGGSVISSGISGSPTFNKAASGTISIASGGRMEYPGPQFTAAGQTKGVAPVLDHLTLPGTGSGPLILRQLESNVEPYFIGAPAAGQRLTIDATLAEWGGPEGYSGTNAGSIVLTSSTSAGTNLAFTNATMVNTGIISLAKGAGGPRHISVAASPCGIDNQGTISLGTQSLALDCDLIEEAGSTTSLTVSSPPFKGHFGGIVSTRSGNLAGTLKVTTTLSALPTGAKYTAMSFSPLTYPHTFDAYIYVGPAFAVVNYDFNVGTVTLVAP